VPRLPITEPYLLLCEGAQDRAFFQALFAAHSITGFVIETPEKNQEGAWGIDKYPRYFTGLIGRTRPNLRGLVVTADCDVSATSRFTQIADWFAAAGYARPTAQLQIVPAQAAPIDFGLMVMLIPHNVAAGCLETLLYPVAAVKWSALVPCVDAYWTCVAPIITPTATVNQESKVRLRALLAAANPQNPNLTLVKLWDDPATALPLTDPTFAPLVTAIRSFCSTV
jgi:hypothetical protein